jgi:hypothetical protein
MANLEKGSTAGGYTILTTENNPFSKDFVQKSPYGTPNTKATAGQYALIGTVTLTSQSAQFVSFINFFSGASGGATNTQRGLLFFRVKQQAALGSPPVIEMSLMNQNNFAPTDLVAVITTNTSSQTVVKLYVHMNLSYDQLWFNPIHELNNSYWTTIEWANKAALIVDKPSLPAGTQFNAILQSGIYGTATITAGTTSVVVNHWFGYSPTFVNCTAQGNLGNVWWDTPTTNSFTIHCSSAPASNTVVSYHVK